MDFGKSFALKFNSFLGISFFKEEGAIRSNCSLFALIFKYFRSDTFYMIHRNINLVIFPFGAAKRKVG